jgi:peroxin-19
MANLMSELDSNPNMQAEFEKMMQELITAGAAGSDPEAGAHLSKAAEAVSHPELSSTKSKPSTATSSSAKKDAPEDFQSTIRRTMERMQASDSTAKASTASAAGPQSEEALLAQMMKELTEGGLGGAGGEEGDFNAMLMNMMAHLTNKEILYEPMKELHDNFPAWMEKNAGKEKKEDLDRYKEQQKLVGEIVGRFERKGYSDDNEDDREYIVERMQKVSTFVDEDCLA